MSLGIENTKEEVNALIQVLDTIANKPKPSNESATNATPVLKKAEVQQLINDFIQTTADQVYS